MNSRKSAKTIPSTLTRLLKSKQLLKTPPSSYYAMLNHPPPPSLIRSNPVRDSADLPPSTTASRSAGQPGAHKQSLDAYHQPPTKYAATRRKPPKTSNSTRSTPLPIVYTQDQIRTQFYRDHPFEAYRDKQLTEQNLIQDEPEPTGLSWTELAQRSIKPTAEDAISYIANLYTHHKIPLAQAYTHGLSQFRTLRAEHELANNAARMEARAHGAVFFGPVEQGLQVEERVLDQWVNARAIQDQIASGAVGGARGSPVAPTAAPQTSSEGMWGNISGSASGSASSHHVPEDVQGEIEFTGGSAYMQRFASRLGRPHAVGSDS